MNPAILARLFQAHADALNDGAPQQDQGQGPPLAMEPGQDLWGVNGGGGGGSQGLDVPGPDMSQSRMQSVDDSTMPPSDYQYLDRVEGDEGPPLGVMFGQEAGQPVGDPTNVPMSQLPPDAQEGTYISPLDMKRMSTQRPR